MFNGFCEWSNRYQGRSCDVINNFLLRPTLLALLHVTVECTVIKEKEINYEGYAYFEN